jgi:hypothetical protein
MYDERECMALQLPHTEEYTMRMNGRGTTEMNINGSRSRKIEIKGTTETIDAIQQDMRYLFLMGMGFVSGGSDLRVSFARTHGKAGSGHSMKKRNSPLFLPFTVVLLLLDENSPFVTCDANMLRMLCACVKNSITFK